MNWVQSAFIYYKNQQECEELADKIIAFLIERGTERVFKVPSHYSNNHHHNTIDPCMLNDKGLVIVLGGDGTFLSAVRWLKDAPISVVGINMGGLGFLTEISRENCFAELENILRGGYIPEERIKIEVTVRRSGRIRFCQEVLNDLVINKGALARIIDFEAHINGKYLTSYRSDGLIVATPTGSTAYNLSAGGPIICPTARAIVITPICSFNLTDRPIVIPVPFEMEILLKSAHQEVCLTCDGQVGEALTIDDVISITLAPATLKFVKPLTVDYFQILRTKLKWGG